MKNLQRITLFPYYAVRRIYHRYLQRYNPRKYAKILHRRSCGRELDLEHPRDLNEKINWMKFNTDTTRWSELADKYRVREYVSECGLDDFLVRLYGVWDTADEIDFSKLPESFVLKTTNGSGTNLIVANKKELDIPAVRKTLNQWVKRPYGIRSVEPHYLSIPPRIIAEELLDVNKQSIVTKSLIDYKIWCFDGKPAYILVCSNRTQKEIELSVFDLDWKYHPEKSVFTSHYKESTDLIPRPETLDEMLRAARLLSAGFPQVRVDFYEVGKKSYFGEMTFTSLGGYMNYFTKEFLTELGDYTKLSKQ